MVSSKTDHGPTDGSTGGLVDKGDYIGPLLINQDQKTFNVLLQNAKSKKGGLVPLLVVKVKILPFKTTGLPSEKAPSFKIARHPTFLP